MNLSIFDQSTPFYLIFNCNRFEQDRRKNEDDTPEWFFGGPVSQHDTIELRGFDEEKDRKQSSKASLKKDGSKERQSAQIAKKTEENSVNGSSSRPSSRLSGKNSKEQDQSQSTDGER